MRTISSNLLTAQRSQNPHAYVRVELNQPVDPFTQWTFDTAGYSGASKRVVRVEDYEEVYGGACTIRLAGYDQFFGNKDFAGWEVKLSYGFRVSTSPDVYEWSTVRTLFVWSQADDASGKNVYTDLHCLDLWWQIAANETLSAGEQIEGELANSSSFVMGETITGSPSGATGILVGVGFDKILVTAVVGSFATDTSASGAVGYISITGVNTVVAASGAASNKSNTIKAIIEAILPASLNGVTVDEDDPDNTITTYQPLLITEANESARNITAQLLQMSKCGGRLENDDYLHVLYLDTTDTAQETYNSVHAHFVQVREQAVIMPNSVLFIEKMPDSLGNAPSYSGTAKDQPSVDMIGEFPTTQVNPSIDANGDVPGGAERFAINWIHQKVAEAFQGRVTAPMNIRQELYDMVQIEDERSGVTVKGRVGRIDRVFTYGKFVIDIRLGGITSDYTGIPGWDDLPTDIKNTVGNIDIETPPTLIDWSKIPWETILPKAIQGFDLEGINFSATDWDTVAWTSGTIRFFDGVSTQAVLSGNTGNLSTADIYYIWFDLADASPNVLKVGTEAQYLTAWTEDVGLLCICQRSLSGTAIKANFFPSRGKMPLITPDRIDMTGTANYDFGGGTYYQALFNNQISAGRIYLSANTYYASETYNIAGKEYAIKRQATAPTGSYDYLWWSTTTYQMFRWNGAAWESLKGEWYNKSGVLVDSTKGIRLYGDDMAFATYDTETNARAGGTTGRQCYMGTDGVLLAGAGAVIIDSNGITIKDASDSNEWITFRDGSNNWRGRIKVTSTGVLSIDAYNNVQLQSDYGGILGIAAGSSIELRTTVASNGNISLNCDGGHIICDSYAGFISLKAAGNTANSYIILEAGALGFIGINAPYLELDAYDTNFMIRRLRQSTQPAVAQRELLIWCDSDDSNRTYLVYNEPNLGTVKVELT